MAYYAEKIEVRILLRGCRLKPKKMKSILKRTIFVFLILLASQPAQKAFAKPKSNTKFKQDINKNAKSTKTTIRKDKSQPIIVKRLKTDDKNNLKFTEKSKVANNSYKKPMLQDKRTGHQRAAEYFKSKPRKIASESNN